MNRRRHRQRGQSLVELCFVLPILLLLFEGVYTAGAFISDMDIAGQATRAGARLGAEVANYGYGTPQAQTAACMGASTTNPCAVDQDIVTSVVTIAKGMTNITSFDEIDIYNPCASGGSCTGATSLCSDPSNVSGKYAAGVDPADVYKLSGGVWTLQGTAGYTLDKRTQNHPSELAIGVRLVFHFQAAAPINFFNVQTAQYETMCFAPYESGG
jgi:Flp pilus assembly protein TadG